MTTVICYIALQIIEHGHKTQWVGNVIGQSIESKAARSGLYVDFSRAIKASHFKLAESQTVVFRVNENNCSYVGLAGVVDNDKTEAGLK